ncbi:MAG: ABC transporter permease [Patescibacteria group bacterium]|jgi:putative ABC transport system permease protein
MKPIDVLRISLSTFVNNKMRTILTIFGIAIGIGAIVFLVSFGYGLQKITIGEIQSIKALKTLMVTSGDSSILSMGDDAVEKFKKIEGTESVNPNLSMSGQVIYGSTRTDSLINAVSAEYLDLEGPRLEAGEQYTGDSDKEIVVTSVAANAFGLSPNDLVGKTVKVAAYIPDPENEKTPILAEGEYTIVGVIKDSVASYLYLPIGTIAIPKNSSYSAIKVKARDTAVMAQMKETLTGLGYKTTSIGEKIDQMNRIFQIAQIVLLTLGAIALVVASIGMFNTLTISLLERTKDIGVMKALGATDKGIYAVFLSEAAIISFAGGFSGIVLSLLSGNILNVVISAVAVRAGGESVKIFQTPWQFIAIIIAFSFIVGILTGLYPARRAARLNPLDALRYE